MNPDIHTNFWIVDTCDEMLQLAALTSTMIGLTLNCEDKSSLLWVLLEYFVIATEKKIKINSNAHILLPLVQSPYFLLQLLL